MPSVSGLSSGQRRDRRARGGPSRRSGILCCLLKGEEISMWQDRTGCGYVYVYRVLGGVLKKTLRIIMGHEMICVVSYL